jgi:hypothetical protein
MTALGLRSNNRIGPGKGLHFAGTVSDIPVEDRVGRVNEHWPVGLSGGHDALFIAGFQCGTQR